MSIIGIIIVLIVIGVLLWLVNTQLAAFMDPKITAIINIVVVIIVILWLLQVFGLLSGLSEVRVK
jgi:hypothetical protein